MADERRVTQVNQETEYLSTQYAVTEVIQEVEYSSPQYSVTQATQDVEHEIPNAAVTSTFQGAEHIHPDAVVTSVMQMVEWIDVPPEGGGGGDQNEHCPPFRIFWQDSNVRAHSWKDGTQQAYHVVRPFGGPHQVDGAKI